MSRNVKPRARKPCNSYGKDRTFGGRMWNATDEERSSAMPLGVFTLDFRTHTRSEKRFTIVWTLESELQRPLILSRTRKKAALCQEATTITHSRRSLMASLINRGFSAGAENISSTSSSNQMQSLASSRAEAHFRWQLQRVIRYPLMREQWTTLELPDPHCLLYGK